MKTCLSIAILVLGGVVSAATASGMPAVNAPASEKPLAFALPLPEGFKNLPGRSWQLIEAAAPGQPVAACILPGPGRDGSCGEASWQLAGTIPPRAGAVGVRRFELRPAAGEAVFEFRPVNDRSLGLWEGVQPVWVYHHGIQSKPGVPAHRNRSTYLHPLYGLDGEVLTDDFPKDHYHHRGLFWAWPHVGWGGQTTDLWMLQGIQQQFERWLARETGAAAAVLAVENGWVSTNKTAVRERVWMRVYPAAGGERMMDLDFYWISLEQPLTLRGAEGKSYGGLTLRFAPRTRTVVTTPLGQDTNDLHITRLAWADLSARFPGPAGPSGAAIFIGPDHPDYPPEWLTRHYGVLCVGWPGVKESTFPPGQVIHCRYRLWVHRDAPSAEAARQTYRAYELSGQVAWETGKRMKKEE